MLLDRFPLRPGDFPKSQGPRQSGARYEKLTRIRDGAE
jgi:hypothetical protein